MNNSDLYEVIKNGKLNRLKELLFEGFSVNSYFYFDLTLLHGSVMLNHLKLVELLLSRGCLVNVRSRFSGGLTPLHFAVKNGHSEIIHLLLNFGANIEKIAIPEISYLKIAILSCSEDIVLKLIQNMDDCDVLQEGKQTFIHALSMGWTNVANILLQKGIMDNPSRKQLQAFSLHVALSSGNVSIFKLLLEYCVDINSSLEITDILSKIHPTPEGEKIVKLLLEHGVDFNLIKSRGMTLLHHSAKNGWIDIVKYLLNKRVDINKKSDDSLERMDYTALYYAVKFKHDKIVSLLLENSADINVTSSVRLPLILVALKNTDGIENMKIINIFKLLLNGGAMASSLDCNNKSILHYAVESGIEELVALSLHENDVNSTTIDGLTPLHLAVSCKNRQQNIVRLLLEQGAYLMAEDKSGMSVIDYTMVTFGNSEILNTIANFLQSMSDNNRVYDLPLSLHDYCVALKTSDKDCSNIFLKAIEKGQTTLIECMFDFGLYSNCSFEDNSPLHYAVMCNQEDVVRILLTHGAQVNLEHKGNVTPLNIAVKCGYVPIIKMLLDFEAVINIDFLFYCVDTNCHELLNLLLCHKSQDVLNKSKNGKSLLHKAAINCGQAIDILIKFGADIELRDENGLTALHYAVIEENMNALMSLIKHGADIDSMDAILQTPLHFACMSRSLRCVRILVRLGASVNTSDYCGKTPLHHASAHYSAEIVEFLLENGADINILDQMGESPLSYWYDFQRALRMVMLFVLHLSKHKALNNNVKHSELFFSRLGQDYFEIMNCAFNQAAKEVEELKKTMLSESTSFSIFYILKHHVKEIEPLTRNAEIVKVFNSADLIKKFPLYGPDLIFKFNVALERKNLLFHCLDVFFSSTKHLPKLPIDCVYKILNYFTNNELKIISGNILALDIFNKILHEVEIIGNNPFD